MQPKGLAIRKRTQIASTNKTMFLWVACVSMISVASLVVSVFLVKSLLFNEKVLQEKAKTIATLKSNISNIDELEKNIRLLDNNESLKSIKSSPDDQAIQVILDALPSDANSLALGASLQNKLLSGIDGLSLDSMQVDQVVGVESFVGDTGVNDESSVASKQSEITFNFVVSGTNEVIKKALVNLEKSIRTIDIMTLKIEKQDNLLVMTLSGRAYYEPKIVVELKDKVIK